MRSDKAEILASHTSTDSVFTMFFGSRYTEPNSDLTSKSSFVDEPTCS